MAPWLAEAHRGDLVSLLDAGWAWAAEAYDFLLHDPARTGRASTFFGACSEANQNEWRLAWVGPVERMVTITDGQIDVSETWKPKLVQLDQGPPPDNFEDLD